MVNTIGDGTKKVTNLMGEKALNHCKGNVIPDLSYIKNQRSSSTSSASTTDIPDTEHYDQVHQVHQVTTNSIGLHDNYSPLTHRPSSSHINEEYQERRNDKIPRGGQNTWYDFITSTFDQILHIRLKLFLLPITVVVYCLLSSGDIVFDYIYSFHFETIAKIELVAFLVHQFGTKKGTVSFNWSNVENRIATMDIGKTMHYVGRMYGLLQLMLYLREVFNTLWDVPFDRNPMHVTC